MDLLILLFMLALVGLGVYLIIRFIPMPAEFQIAIKVVAAIVVLLYLFRMFSGSLPNVLP